MALSLGRRQAIIWNNADLLSIRPQWTYFDGTLFIYLLYLYIFDTSTLPWVLYHFEKYENILHFLTFYSIEKVHVTERFQSGIFQR